jgi:hypothetical protein
MLFVARVLVSTWRFASGPKGLAAVPMSSVFLGWDCFCAIRPLLLGSSTVCACWRMIVMLNWSVCVVQVIAWRRDQGPLLGPGLLLSMAA